MKDREQIKSIITTILKEEYIKSSHEQTADKILAVMDKQKQSSPVEGKGWEIYEYKTPIEGAIYTLLPGGKYKNLKLSDATWEAETFNHGEIINAVRLTSTGEIYRIGDTIVHNNNREKEAFTIKKFRTDDSGYYMYANGDNNYQQARQEYWKKVPQPVTVQMDSQEYRMYREWKEKQEPLIITDDGVKFYNELDEVWLINGDGKPNVNPSLVKNCGKHVRERQQLGNGNTWHIFSTKEKMDEYILMNKPLLSVRNIIDNCKIGPMEDWLKVLAKEQLNKQ